MKLHIKLTKVQLGAFNINLNYNTLIAKHITFSSYYLCSWHAFKKYFGLLILQYHIGQNNANYNASMADRCQSIRLNVTLILILMQVYC